MEHPPTHKQHVWNPSETKDICAENVLRVQEQDGAVTLTQRDVWGQGSPQVLGEASPLLRPGPVFSPCNLSPPVDAFGTF